MFLSQHSILCGIPSHSVFVTSTPLGPAFVAANPTVQCGAGVIRCLRPLGPAFVAANPTVHCGAGVRRLRPLGPAFVAANPTVQCGAVTRTAGQANSVQRLKATIIHVTLQFVGPSSMSAFASPEQPSTVPSPSLPPALITHSPAGAVRNLAV